jgi:hypothetical protein
MSTQLEIMAFLDRFKWNDKFCCLKCGNKDFIEGKQPFSRRCKKCKYDESLLKSTAFEGLRFPIEKAFDIIEYTTENCYLDVEAKIIPVGRKNKKTDKEESEFFEFEEEEKEIKMISMMDYVLKSKEKKVSEETIDRKLNRIVNQHKLTVGKLSKEFEVEENTIIKLFDKISSRIKIEDESESSDSFGRVLSFLNFPPKRRNVTYLTSMLMVSLPGKWEYGTKTIGDTNYFLCPMNDTWGVYYIQQEVGYGSYIEVENGTDQWFELFHE